MSLLYKFVTSFYKNLKGSKVLECSIEIRKFNIFYCTILILHSNLLKKVCFCICYNFVKVL